MNNTTLTSNDSLRHVLQYPGSNTSLAFPQSDNTFYEAVRAGEKCLLPLICVCGFLGNTLSCVLFLKLSVGLSSSSIFLATRSLVDNGFLLNIFIVWVSTTFHLRLNQVPNLCKAMVYLTYVCGCMSAWLMVFLAFENYLRICRPMLVQRVYNIRNARKTLLVAILLILIIYQLPLWILNESCAPVPEFIMLTHVLVYGDTVITLIIPTGLIATALCSITTAMLRSLAFNRHRRQTAETRPTNILGKLTRFLYSVTIISFCLSIPSHVIRLKLLVKTFTDQSSLMSATDAGIQTVTLLIYYSSMAISFFVYYIFGDNFRRSFNDMLCRHCKSSCTTGRMGSSSNRHQPSNEAPSCNKSSYVILSLLRETE